MMRETMLNSSNVIFRLMLALLVFLGALFPAAVEAQKLPAENPSSPQNGNPSLSPQATTPGSNSQPVDPATSSATPPSGLSNPLNRNPARRGNALEEVDAPQDARDSTTRPATAGTPALDPRDAVPANTPSMRPTPPLPGLSPVAPSTN